MIYGSWRTTGEVKYKERKCGKRYAFDECVCVCGTKRFVRHDFLVNGKSQSCRANGKSGCNGGAPRSQPRTDADGFYVRHLSASWIPQWAAGSPTMDNPWVKDCTEPPATARKFTTKQDAAEWIALRRETRKRQGRPTGEYAISDGRSA